MEGRQGSNGALAGAPVVAGAASGSKAAVTTTVALGSSAPLRGRGRRMVREWWKNRTDELAIVTNEPHNEELGILNIEIQAPSQGMKDAGIIARVSMETLTGWDYGITIRESKDHPGDIMVMAGGSRPRPQQAQPAEGQQAARSGFWNDRRFNDATAAQILSYVSTFLIPATPAVVPAGEAAK